MPEETPTGNNPPADSQEKEQKNQTINLREALGSPEGKSILGEFVAEETRGLKTALESAKTRLSKYVLEEDENGQRTYIDPEIAREAQKQKTNGKQENKASPSNQLSVEEEVERVLAKREASIRDTEVTPLKTELDEERGFTRHLLIENELDRQLDAVGVQNPALKRAAKSLLGSVYDVVAHEGNRKVVVKSPDGKSEYGASGLMTIEEHVKVWAASEEGKHFVSAPRNTGGEDGKRSEAISFENKTITKMSDLKTRAERIAYVKEFGAEMYEKLPVS